MVDVLSRPKRAKYVLNRVKGKAMAVDTALCQGTCYTSSCVGRVLAGKDWSLGLALYIINSWSRKTDIYNTALLLSISTCKQSL